MNKTDHIEYWKISAGKSLDVSRHLFEKANYVECLHFTHLTFEKIIKAHWVKFNGNNLPPRNHNLRTLATQAALSLTPNQAAFLDQMNAFDLENGLPDYQFDMYQTFDEQKTKPIFDEAENLYQWLLNKLL